MTFDMNDPLLPASNKSVDTQAGSDSKILTVEEVAYFLRVPKSTIYKLARMGGIPASKVGKHWRFVHKDLQAWMQHRSSG
jgi:excisionase family DNA binding protein